MNPHPRVLIVDDEPNIVLSLQFLLSREGYEVDVARDGEEALETALRTTPDLVVLDLMLPGLDGYEVCRRLRAAPQTAAKPEAPQPAVKDAAKDANDPAKKDVRVVDPNKPKPEAQAAPKPVEGIRF